MTQTTVEALTSRYNLVQPTIQLEIEMLFNIPQEFMMATTMSGDPTDKLRLAFR